MRDFLDDLREHWDDHYWWADHQLLQAALIALVAGLIGLGFTYLETRMRISMKLTEAA